MKLEIAEFPVKQIRLGHRFAYDNQVLEVDEAAVARAGVARMRGSSDVSLAVAAPGEKTRITGISDIVEPTMQSFRRRPGFSRSVGRGRRSSARGGPIVCRA